MLCDGMVIARFRQMFSAPVSIAPEKRVFCIPDGVRIYAVGDVHGRSGVLRTMLSAIAEDARLRPVPRVIEVFLGDYIDRGLYSREVVDVLLHAPPDGHERICLLGNHEQTLLHFLKDPKVLRDWANFGGYATLASYGVPIPATISPETVAVLRDRLQQNMPAAHAAFFKNLQLRYILGDYLFVHAGLMPGLAWDMQKPDNLLWIREPFLQHEGYFEQYVVHGHSPVAVADIRPNRANIDITAAAVNSLCSLVIEGDERRVMVVESRDE